VLKKFNLRITSIFLLILLPPAFLQDYEINTEGLYCVFKRNIKEIRAHLTAFLSAFTDLSGECLYFEVIKANEAILKLYHIEGLRFQDHLLSSQPMHRNSDSLEEAK
jgi:hypothetical protein